MVKENGRRDLGGLSVKAPFQYIFDQRIVDPRTLQGSFASSFQAV